MLVCASAVGLYGFESGDKEFTEAGPKGSGFLADVVSKWEAESAKAKCRVVNARFGVILSTKAGALAKLLPIFQLGGGGILGDGKQYFPYVSERDAVSAVKYIPRPPIGSPYPSHTSISASPLEHHRLLPPRSPQPPALDLQPYTPIQPANPEHATPGSS